MTDTPPTRWDPPDDWERAPAWPAPGASAPPAWFPPPAGDPPLVGTDRVWVPTSHWIALATTWLGPFVILLTVGESSPRVREHAKESLNFEITFWLLMLVAALGTFVVVGYVFLVLLPILWLVLRVMAAMDAAAGKSVRYPLTLRMVR